MDILGCCLLVTFWLTVIAEASNSPWADWWAYTGIAGPDNWSALNPAWKLCRQGRLQSPINIEPRLLLFDPNLRRMDVLLPEKIAGTLTNTGNDLTLVLDDVISNGANFSDGPLLYGYRASHIKFHLGKTNEDGSEHKIDGRSFGAEIQVICYNSDLFKTLEDARKRPYGVAIFSVMAEIADTEDSDNGAFKYMAAMARTVPWQGQRIRISDFPLKALIPATNYYMTYDGSFTQPGCLETVTWVIFNKPIFIQPQHLDTIRQLQKEQPEQRMTMLEGNNRPLMPLNNRAVRTNINFRTATALCNMRKTSYYEANDYTSQRQRRKS